MASEMFSDFSLMSDTGVLWAINRYLFHPRGYALALIKNDEEEVTGWQILGDGKQIFTYTEDSDDNRFVRFESFLEKLKGKESDAVNSHLVAGIRPGYSRTVDSSKES